ncbi:MAG: electron transfer flavoprotein subunit alpha/FixB family protein [Chloroflexi bacterium]|nr:MAG: electron transfer flavoprotein subunit alpha/FixB family protein [Chloroflexota bacterium]
MDFSYLDMWNETPGQEEGEAAVEGDRNVWMFAETVNGGLHPAALESMGQARELADAIGVYAYGVLLGVENTQHAEALIARGADRILVAGDPLHPDKLAAYQPEIFTLALAALIKQYRPEIFLLPATDLGNDLAPRLAHHLSTGLISHCVKVEMDMAERLLVGTCPALGGEVYHAFTIPLLRPQIATLEPGYFRSPVPNSSRTGEIQQVDIDLEYAVGRLTWSKSSTTSETTPGNPKGNLRRARVVVAGGRGMGNQAGFALVRELAAALNASVAGSRGAFDQGWITEDEIVGVSGETIAPDLYIACGLSGEIYHTFSVQDARFIIAINTDQNAPIMKGANIALVADARQVIPGIIDAVKENRLVQTV